ncbi:hypothetical protein [Persephonella sp.]|uniref:hypothetical protein n=1 Tax=Persephonella sp. TaxID=2060922 RepID=UPI00260D459A|nr:hypothetical protein [Persephonella sp.]
MLIRKIPAPIHKPHEILRFFILPRTNIAPVHNSIQEAACLHLSVAILAKHLVISANSISHPVLGSSHPHAPNCSQIGGPIGGPNNLPSQSP